MNLNLTWTNPTPHAPCGYKAFYRRKSDPQYTELDTSGNSSGTTTLSISVPAPANYEGYVQSDCCDSLISTGDPFGVNSYLTFHAVAAKNAGLNGFQVTITSAYANPYPTVITGSFDYTITITPVTIPFTVTYPAGSTSAVLAIGTGGQVTFTGIVSNTKVYNYAPSFTNGGTLQQLDSVLTPSYFKLYWDGNTSGSTWDGSPTDLPSFTLDQFNVTEIDGSGVIQAGDLLISWVQANLYNSGVSPNNIITLEVYDPTPILIGSTIINAGPVGLRESSIALTKASYVLTTATLFTMKALWADDTLINSRTFYLPGI